MDDVPAEGDESADPTPRIPEPDPDDQQGKRFMVGSWESLRVQVSGGDVGMNYAPARLLGELAEQIAKVVETFNGGRAVLYRVVPGQSMVLYLGDPHPDDPQAELPVQQTLSAARIVADLMVLDDDQLFERALEIGPEIRSYDGLARLVANEGITVNWEPREGPPAELEPKRAAKHHKRLSEEPETRDREMAPLEGVLYRVIEDPREKRGRIGIGLFKSSPEPPGHKAPGTVLIDFEGEELHERIKSLIGEAVEVEIRVREPVIGKALDLGRVKFVLVDIRPGAGDVESYGPSLFDPDDWQAA